MLEDNPFAPRAICCPVHPKQKVTYICTDCTCQNTPFLCSLCYNDHRKWSLHPHESSVKPLNEGIESISTLIRNQNKSIELVYDRTIGHRDNENIKFNLEKGRMLAEEVQSRLESLQMQVEVEMERLLKDFQNKMQLEKQELLKKMQDYKEQLLCNIQFIRKDCTELLTFQNSLKYYNNANTLTLKLILQSQRNSNDWFLTQKQVLNKITQITQNPSFVNTLMYTLTKCNKNNMLTLPPLGKQIKEIDQNGEIRKCIKNNFTEWLELPELIDLSHLKVNQYIHSNKYIPYSTAL